MNSPPRNQSYHHRAPRYNDDYEDDFDFAKAVKCNYFVSALICALQSTSQDIKLDLRKFDGKIDPDNFRGWLSRVEMFAYKRHGNLKQFLLNDLVALYGGSSIRNFRCIKIMLLANSFLAIDLQQVFDYDTFSADDIMGEAEVDIQPLITSAVTFGDAGMFENIQIGKWLKSHDNALTADSIINIVDGKVKQEVSLKLQKVESGEVELELEWIPLDQ
ncbi:hypothetical protein GIB67_015493 [Kingdonia uniflora]|uniref:Uncharacterized protein n=1 Tax=Kingdonia uniflora TaxID=39325 RepID=A0A7J7LA48_9MAGN|nr:hypothetical protein GIB67_015493 [Kingdonia uniflora]